MWDEITAWLLAKPDLTEAGIFRELQRLNPGRSRPTQIRTLQRGLNKLRALLVTFNDQWGEEAVNGHAPTPQLRGEIVAGIF